MITWGECNYTVWPKKICESCIDGIVSQVWHALLEDVMECIECWIKTIEKSQKISNYILAFSPFRSLWIVLHVIFTIVVFFLCFSNKLKSIYYFRKVFFLLSSILDLIFSLNKTHDFNTHSTLRIKNGNKIISDVAYGKYTARRAAPYRSW